MPRRVYLRNSPQYELPGGLALAWTRIVSTTAVCEGNYHEEDCERDCRSVSCCRRGLGRTACKPADWQVEADFGRDRMQHVDELCGEVGDAGGLAGKHVDHCGDVDRKSTRLNSSHLGISYAVFCLKKKEKQ